MSDIKTQLLVAKYKAYEQQLLKLDTNEEMIKVFNSHKSFFSEFFKLFQQQIHENDFSMHYQPQMSKGKCSQAEAEALFRCKVGQEFIHPQVAFALAECFGFEKQLSITVLSRVCEDVSKFQKYISPDFRVSFNVNPTIIDEGFYKQFYFTIANHQLAPSSVGIELVESSSSKNLDPNLMQSFLRNGTQIFIDDYGSGFANKESVSSLPFTPTHLKLDGSLIQQIHNRPEQQAAVREALVYCQQNDVIPVFEKVSNQDELNTITSLISSVNNQPMEGTDCLPKPIEDVLIQGFYFSKPLTAEKLIDFSQQVNSQLQETSENE